MSKHHERGRESQQQADYSAAVAKALEWLGDRYLLAKPLMQRSQRRSHMVSSINREH
jgi:hypothetical protein